jgi:hypothetical protein
VAPGFPDVTAIHLGCLSPGSSVLPTRELPGAPEGEARRKRRKPSAFTYLVLLRVEIARFTRHAPAPFWGHLSRRLRAATRPHADSSLLL